MHTMAAGQDRQAVVRLGFGAAAILTFALLGVTLGPAPAEAAVAKTLEECVDGEWADYNSCLMNAGTSWGRKMCDIYFQAGVALCAAKYAGEVKTALESGF